MKSLISKDKVYRNNFSKFELFSNLEKLLKKSSVVLNFQKPKILFFSKVIRNHFYRLKIKNRCLLTGRSSSVSRIYSVSRIFFRNLGREGFIPGLKKSSW